MSDIVEKFVEKYGKVVSATPIDITNFLIKSNKKFYKEAIDYNKYFEKNNNSNEITLFKNLDDMFSIYFYKGENYISLKKGSIIGPLLAKINNKSKLISIGLENKKIKVYDTYVFAFYNRTKNTFMWAHPEDAKFICENSVFHGHSFCKVNMIKNVEKFEADILALWFRLMVYMEKNIKNSKLFLGDFKTTNLILFNTEIDKDEYTIYTLMDYGIKDPKFDVKISTKINLLNQLISSKSNKKSMKGNKMYKGKDIDKLKL